MLGYSGGANRQTNSAHTRVHVDITHGKLYFCSLEYLLISITFILLTRVVVVTGPGSKQRSRWYYIKAIYLLVVALLLLLIPCLLITIALIFPVVVRLLLAVAFPALVLAVVLSQD